MFGLHSFRKTLVGGHANGRPARSVAQSALLEPLESRTLLSADLSGFFPTVPPSDLTTPPGVRVDVEFMLENTGDAAARGTTAVDLFAFPDGSAFDPDTAVFLGSTRISGTLQPWEPGDLELRGNIPADAAPGNYRLAAVVDPENRIPENFENNNTAVSGQVFEVLQLDFDLTGEFRAGGGLQPAIVLGSAAAGTYRVQVTNSASSTSVPPKGATVGVQVFARPLGAADASQDVLLNTRDVSVSLNNLQPGRSRPASVKVAIPGNMTAGDYQIVLKVDGDNDIVETDDTNNESLLGQTVSVAAPFVDLTAVIGSKVKLPSAVVAGDATKIKLPVEIKNEGNVAIARGQKISVRVVAQRVGDQAQVQVGTFENISISGLKPDAVKKLNLNVTLPIGLDGDYQLLAQIDSAAEVDEKFEDNNEAATDPADTITVADGFVDLTAVIGSKAKLPSMLLSGDGTTIKLPVEIKNEGNVAIAKGQVISVGIVARRVSDGAEVQVATFNNVSISSLKPDKVKKLNFNITLPGDLDGDYQLVARVDSSSQLVESNESNNEAVANTPINMVEDYLSLTRLDTAGATWDYVGKAAAGGVVPIQGSGTVAVDVTAAGTNRFVSHEVADTQDGSFDTEEQSFTWFRGTGGIVLQSRSQEIDLGKLVFTYNQLIVSPPTMALRQKHTDSAPTSVNFDIDGAPDIILNGTATVTTTLVGYETITVPAGTFEVAKISLVYTYQGEGLVDTAAGKRLMTLKLNESMTIWATPDVGIVKSTNKSNVRISTAGSGGASETANQTQWLTDSSLL